MFFTREIGKVLRGRSTPFLIIVSGILAGALAFQPGFGAAPGIFATIVLLLVILNGSLPFAFLVWGPAKLLSQQRAHGVRGGLLTSRAARARSGRRARCRRR